MPKIKPLSEDLVNKIAAGEVIERPASVVKELVENSIDSGATNILVEIKESGKSLIRISDNGSGMDKLDAKMSIVRHATSKISSQNDLFAINSLGFRGEALASIAAVSQLTISTKEKDALEGFLLSVEGGVIKKEQVVGAQDGTTIEVKNLFFNTPARKKFLKTDLIELKHIIEVVTKYALHYPNISFTLINEGRTILQSPSTMHARSNVASIYGAGVAKELLEVKHFDSEKRIHVKGFVSKPLSARNDKVQQTLFVNNRLVRNKDISQAIYDAYHSLLFHSKHPIFVLSVNLDPQAIDVNVHPAKTEIKIEEKDLVYRLVYDAVHNTLKSNNLIPDFNNLKTEQVTFGTPKPQPKKTSPQYPFEKSNQVLFKKDTNQSKDIETKQLQNEDFVELRKPSESIESNKSSKYNTNYDFAKNRVVREEVKSYSKDEISSLQTQAINDVPRYDISGSSSLPPMRILGQIHKTFFVAEIPQGMVLIDQHVVHERVNYEKFMEQYLNKNVETQQLLEKKLITFTATQALIVSKNLELLKKLGFELKHFGGSDYQLISVPTLLGRTQQDDLIHKIIEELEEGKVKEIERIQEEIITRMACRASIKAGDTVTIPHITELLKELANCKLPYTCPHGRAIIIKISAEELEKKFLRKG